MFLRFGYAVGHVGLLGMFLILAIGHAITIPTGLAIAEIATNLKVEGGGEYFIISRSFGATVGGAIGLSLYMSQGISVAFYMIAFSEAFRPLVGLLERHTGFVADIRMVGIPATVILLVVILLKGASLGVKTLWIVVSVLVVSLLLFFAGGPIDPDVNMSLLEKVRDPDGFTTVFAIVFPAFTGITAGVGLSGDLRKPSKSIPLGTLLAGLAGLLVYAFIVVKLAMSATPQDLATDQFVMSRIALWGPIIPIGLAAATLSSAIGSLLVAPRTLQALAGDRIFPIERFNRFLSAGRGKVNEPMNATIVTAVIVLAFVSMGGVDFVAQIISMFFMITYGAICSISFLEHFAGNPSYRPTFRSKWYLSLVGALGCFAMMFAMQPIYAAMAFVLMVVVYTWLRRTRKGERDLSEIVKGVLFQLTRTLQVLIQKRKPEQTSTNWRPSFLAISSSSLRRLAPFDLLRWISYHYGFGTFIHFHRGLLNHRSHEESQRILGRLIAQTQESDASIYVDTIISPSFRTAVAQIVQMPGLAGMENNSILFEFDQDDPGAVDDILEGCEFASVVGYNICVLRSSDRHFGYRRHIHIWITSEDYRNANLKILLAYIIMGHPDWKGSEISLFVSFRAGRMEAEVARLNELIAHGRIPISRNNVVQVHNPDALPFNELVVRNSRDADLVITGFSLERLAREKGSFFKRFEGVSEILFVRAGQEILITENARPDAPRPVPADDEDGPVVEVLEEETGA
jgi:amino acid transporter